MKKKFIITVAIAAICLCTASALLIKGKHVSGEYKKSAGTDVIGAATEAELNGVNMGQYIDNFIEVSSIKRAMLIGFKNEADCAAFILEHGTDDDPRAAGLGTVLKERTVNGESFFNPIGTELEEIYNGLNDGEYSPEPIYCYGSYCFFRRIGNLPTAGAEEINAIFGKEIVTSNIEEGEENEISQNN